MISSGQKGFLRSHSSTNLLPYQKALKVHPPTPPGWFLNGFVRGAGNPNYIRGAPVLSLNVASKDKLDSKALYFVRTNAKGVSQNIELDVCYGEVPSDPLADFDFILGQVHMATTN